jgi:hypothetical protein
VVLEVGLSLTVVPLNDPGIQLYVEAPDPVSVTALPVHTAEFDEDALTTGRLFTVTATVAVLEHPAPFEPVTVYVVVTDGETPTLVPLNDPGIQVYVAAPAPVSVAVLPTHIGPLDDAVTVGGGPTVTVTV